MNSDSDGKDDHTATATAGKDDATTHDAVHEIEQQIEQQIAQAKHYYDETSRRWFNFSIEKENLRYKVEAIARDCLTFVIATSMSIFGLGVIVPPAMGALLPIATGVFSLMLPSLMFSIFGIHPGIIGCFFLFLVFTTIFLSAVTVSDGLFVIVFALATFLSMGSFFNYFRPGVDPLSIATPPIVMCISSMFTLSFRNLVQNGLSIDFDPSNISDLSETGITLVNASSTLIDILETTSEREISFVCPVETGLFAGQTCTIESSTSPGMLTVSVNGGLYIVAALWTERGINNSLAFASNMMIGICWMTACFAVVILFPPIRKFRNMLTNFIIPGTLENVAGILESHNNNATGEIDDPFAEGRDKLQMMAKKIAPKKNAGMLLFEPRLCHDPTIDYIPHMETFLGNIQSLILILYEYHGYHKAKGIDLPDQSETVNILREVASAVKKNDVSILDGLSVTSIDFDGNAEEGLPDMSLSNVCAGMTSRIYSSSLKWLKMYNNNEVKREEKHRTNAILRTFRAWFTSAMCSCDIFTTNWILVSIRLILRKQGASLEKIGTRRLLLTLLWSAKWTGGAVALICLQLWSKGYYNLSTKQASTDLASTGVISDWELIAYFFSFQFTMEGTIKKGLMRAVGTMLGGFSAWIGYMLCSLSYDGANPVNPYAWIAWLTVNLFIANFHGKGSGVTAFLGQEYDTPFFAFYYILTFVLIGMESFLGEYSINEGVARRVSNNLLGIAIAMFISILPPYYSVKDPNFIIEYIEEMQNWQRSVAHQYVETHAISMESVMQLEDDLTHFRRKAELILTDKRLTKHLEFR